jgi:hypothetical protein
LTAARRLRFIHSTVATTMSMISTPPTSNLIQPPASSGRSPNSMETPIYIA